MIFNQVRFRPHVLLIDDSPTNLRVMGNILAEHYIVQAATSGQDALNLLETTTELPDLILLDVVMPQMDGYDTCRAIKLNEATRDIPVIFITGIDSIDAEMKGFECGGVDFISKPINAPIMRARVKIHITLKQQADMLENLAMYDGLTKIANRRAFDEHLTREWRRMQRQASPISLLMLDVDHFKQYNDYYGHDAGDQCLQKVAQSLADLPVRPGDLAARYGGEEFAIILPETDTNGAWSIGNRVLETIRELNIPHEHSATADTVSVSIGGATAYPKNGDLPERLLKQADQQLYKGKTAGRNCMYAVTLGEPDLP